MERWTLFLLVVVVLNALASWRVLRLPLLERPQRILQLVLTWLVPLVGAIICLVFAYTHEAMPESEHVDALRSPNDGQAVEGPPMPFCGCAASALDSGGDGGGD